MDRHRRSFKRGVVANVAVDREVHRLSERLYWLRMNRRGLFAQLGREAWPTGMLAVGDGAVVVSRMERRI